MRVAVIGAGLGGMAAAIRLAVSGVKVDVFEQSGETGGKAASLWTSGYRFDTGPSLLTMPFVFRQLFEDAGARWEDHVELVPLEPLSTNFFADGTVLRDSSDLDSFAAALGAASVDAGREDLERYLDHARRLYDSTAPWFLMGSLHEAVRTRKLRPRDFAALLRLDAARSLHRAHAAFFRDRRLVQLFDRYATFNGSDPYRAPATLAVIPAVEYGFGGYTVRGGIIRIPRAFELLARRLGVRFHLGARVQRIIVDGGRARGLQVDGLRLEADAVVTNADVRTTYRDLLPSVRDRLGRRYERLTPSSSALVFLWGVKASFPELSVSNIFFPKDYRQEFLDLFTRRTCPVDPTVFVNITSKVTPSDAPPGCENWFVMVNAPADEGQPWDALAAGARVAVLSRLRAALGRDVEGLIRAETVLTPVDIARRTSSARGSLYGISSNSRAAAFLRHPNRHPRIRGLYFCGGSAHPGGGMPLVTLSGRTAAELLLKYEAGA
ncbi:MAG TPA: phytoene desaturase family protein [Spirochaetia bacterium]|nr:phytoene desaturase family protein [Spirochaetia bacterium]